MTDWLTAVILGIVEGLTEFLPVSSTGHLIIAGHLLDFAGKKAATFEIVIQLGAILSVVVLYFQRFTGLLIPKPGKRFSGKYGIYLLFLTTLPASIIGLLIHGLIKQHLFSPIPVAWALGVGALGILVVERINRLTPVNSIDELTPKIALGIGMFQCLALWPGFSRSAATIMGGMLLGADRKVAAEYSFIAAVPVMVAATGYDLLKNLHALTAHDLLLLAIGFIVSFFSALVAVKTFIALLKKMTLRPFAYYRLLIVPIILIIWL